MQANTLDQQDAPSQMSGDGGGGEVEAGEKMKQRKGRGGDGDWGFVQSKQ